jgi:hypothetical protein
MQALRSQERRREDLRTGPHAFLVAGRTLVLTLTGGRMPLPLMLVYNAYQCTVFRGKVRSSRYSWSGPGQALAARIHSTRLRITA